jgi:hypothetical protein
MAIASVPPNISHEARHRIGLMRLPPAIREYFIDSIIFSTFGDVAERDESKAFSTTFFFVSKYLAKSNLTAVLLNDTTRDLCTGCT